MGQCLKMLIDDDNLPVSFGCSPNGRFILAGLLDSTLRLWNYHKGKCLHVLGPQEPEVLKLRRLLDDGPPARALRLRGRQGVPLDPQSKQQVQTLEGHSDVVLGVACHPTADMIVTGGMDKDLRRSASGAQAAAGVMAPAGRSRAFKVRFIPCHSHSLPPSWSIHRAS